MPDGHSTDERRALRHDGYEYGLILSGTLQANVGFDRLELGPGDSIAFDSSIPHEYWNRTRQRRPRGLGGRPHRARPGLTRSAGRSRRLQAVAEPPLRAGLGRGRRA